MWADENIYIIFPTVKSNKKIMWYYIMFLWFSLTWSFLFRVALLVEQRSCWHQGRHKLESPSLLVKFNMIIEALNIDTKTHARTHTHTFTLTHAPCTHTYTGWPSSLREGGYPSFHSCLPVSGRRFPWKQGLTGNNRRERKKSGALPTSPLLLLCVPLSKYPFPTHDAFLTNYRFSIG